MDLKITPLSDGLGAEAIKVDLSKTVDGEPKRASMRRSPKMPSW